MRRDERTVVRPHVYNCCLEVGRCVMICWHPAVLGSKPVFLTAVVIAALPLIAEANP